MKIVFFVENNRAGGMDSFFINVINNWPSEEDNIVLICNDSHPGLTNIKDAVIRNIDFIDIDLPLNWVISEKYFGWLPNTIRRATQPILKIILFPYQLRKLKELFAMLDADRLMVVNGAYPGGESCRAATIAWAKIGKTISIHNIRNFAIRPRWLISWYENWIDRKLFESISCFVGVSKCCTESLKLRPHFKDNKKLKHIYNGTPIKKSSELVQHPISLRKDLEIGRKPMCLMLATYELRKGHEFIFEVFKRVNSIEKEAHLVICGDGSKKEKHTVDHLKKSIAPDSNIHLLDFIANGRDLISQADILVVPSQEWESFGWTVIEAMTRNIPVVSTNSGGLAEVIGTNGIAGYSIDPDDHEAFSDAIINLLQDSLLRKKISDAGYKRVVDHFNVERMAREYSELIRADL